MWVGRCQICDAHGHLCLNLYRLGPEGCGRGGGGGGWGWDTGMKQGLGSQPGGRRRWQLVGGGTVLRCRAV